MNEIIIHQEPLTTQPPVDGDYHFFTLGFGQSVQLLEPEGICWVMAGVTLPTHSPSKTTVGNVSVENGIQEGTIIKLLDTALRAVTVNK